VQAASRWLAGGDPLASPHEELIARLNTALAADLPHLARDGGFIASGYAARLDELRVLRDDSRRHIAALQARYAEETGIASLKIKHNNVLGYYIEVTAAHADKLMSDKRRGDYIHRQTMAGAVRFATVALSELERQVAEAGDKAIALELELFAALSAQAQGAAAAIIASARAIADLDVATAMAELAHERDWRRPEMTDGLDFSIEGGRHPSVEKALAEQGGGPFIPNDCDLAPQQRLWLLTGPNMAGKSTFLRQNALIAILAHIGCFVPAARARIGIIDKLFSRVGAADDLARGRSTFMVEMVETAAILNQATAHSLVILDEIGRGTATFDGLSIAWATVEHLHDTIRCRGLFATHYHELTALAAKLPALACRSMRVKEWRGDVVFLHEVAQGAADRSYGIHVARLAGLPKSVLARAERTLHALERSELGSPVARLSDDLPLFATLAANRTTANAETERNDQPSVEPEHPALSPWLDEARTLLVALDPDAMTPRQALDALYRLRDLIIGGEGASWRSK
jgi:DNA mismatch repair protein MutS